MSENRIRHRTTPNSNDVINNLFWNDKDMIYHPKSRVVPYRIRLFPTLISKLKWFESGLPLNPWQILENSSIFSKFQFKGYELSRFIGKLIHILMSFPLKWSGSWHPKKLEFRIFWMSFPGFAIKVMGPLKFLWGHFGLNGVK